MMCIGSEVPDIRIRAVLDDWPAPNGQYVLYWMTAFRRGHDNFSLQRAVDWARELNKPLVILEALRCDYRWASDRLHRWIIEGMKDNAEHFSKKPVTYYPYVEQECGAAKGLFEALASRASVVVSDDFPCFFLPRMIAAAEKKIRVRFELVDSNGLLPLRAADRVFVRAFDFRRFLQTNLLRHLSQTPKRDPLRGVRLPRLESLPDTIAKRWPASVPEELLKDAKSLARLPIDHSVRTVAATGGSRAADKQLSCFLQEKLKLYATYRNHPDMDVTSRLSPYLHFGHVSAHRIFEEVIRWCGWTPDQISSKADWRAPGWWGMDKNAESFLDELITWRELGFNMCWQREDYDRYESLPAWALKTLEEHAGDPRPYVYSLEELEKAQTHDPLWNAAQRQLLSEGTIHNYLRMLWGKKILEWSTSARDALDVMIELNNKYAIDGRDPNSYSGIFWVLGRYDRPWGPERPIFGKIRYMSSENTMRKVQVRRYLARYGPD
ncbi:MAG: deoxyribodipyrimidine photo-lyase [Pirellulaceae bacterium]|nr:MAG: deoxyribodipyrimidine photo-lyase [Pirellulaceae bacterium]